jgi:HPt (histidine-containing phosphotransfer) domain-containing protein
LYAHDIKGAARNIGADEVGRVAKDMEDSAREGKFNAITENLPKLRTAFEQLQDTFAKYVKECKR